ncbi:N5-glutamine methyltransferase family protein [Salinicoccus sp. CNSTN-B1]
MPPYSYRDMVREAEASLIAHGKEPRIAVLLLEDLLSMDTTSRLVDGHLEVPDAARELYQRALERVEQGEPHQYVSGTAWFYGEAFKVNAHTLIPRNETEELVALVLDKEKDDGRTIVDIGSGTGAIGITLGKAWKKNEVILTDLSGEALHVAAENAERHGVSPQMLSGTSLLHSSNAISKWMPSSQTPVHQSIRAKIYGRLSNSTRTGIGTLC